MSARRILVISHDVVGTHMAGPGIRYRELARVLSGHFHTTLAVPGESDLVTPQVDVWPYERGCWDSLANIARQADVVVACGDTLAEFPTLGQLPVPLVIDGYDPHTLETLALWADQPADLQSVRHRRRLAILQHQCQVGDFFICASERQRDWWLGLLEMQGRVNPQTYKADPSLRRLVDVVPYGLPLEPPQATQPILRGVWPGLGLNDPIVLWGGGLWEWLDPLTAVRAIHHLESDGHPIRLVFPGTRHPNPDMPDMPVRARAMALAGELGLSDRCVFFGDWIPYKDWPAALLEANIGLSLHGDTVEARLAYRSRVLDYVWTSLPMILTRGDATSQTVEHHGLGIVVDYEDHLGVAEAILELLDQPRSARQDGFARARAEMTWERTAQPLIEFCRSPVFAADRPALDMHLQGGSRQGARPQGPELDELHEQIETLHQTAIERDAEIARLRTLVADYEQGRFMRLMRRVHQVREKVGV
jgi:glycosyltransferase involved in cell wall biosynthesis